MYPRGEFALSTASCFDFAQGESQLKHFMVMFGLITLSAVAGQAAYACTCVTIKRGLVVNENPPVKPDNAKPKPGLGDEYAVALFTGQVVKIEKVKVKEFDTSSQMNKVTVNVEKYWIGVKAPQIVIFTASRNGSSGVSYMKGKSYFFWSTPVGGLLKTQACSPKDVDNELIPVFNDLFGGAKEFP
jgi:hypothetical protein